VAKETKVAEVEEKFEVALLSKHADKAMGVAREVFDGALYGYEEKEISKEEAKKLIEAFLAREVK